MPNAQQSVDRECWRAQKPGVCCVRCAAARLSCNLSQFTKYQNNLSEMNWNERFRVNYVNICIESSTGNTIDTPYCHTPTTALNQQLRTPGAENSFSFGIKATLVSSYCTFNLQICMRIKRVSSNLKEIVSIHGGGLKRIVLNIASTAGLKRKFRKPTPM